MKSDAETAEAVRVRQHGEVIECVRLKPELICWSGRRRNGAEIASDLEAGDDDDRIYKENGSSPTSSPTRTARPRRTSKARPSEACSWTRSPSGVVYRRSALKTWRRRAQRRRTARP